MTNQVKPKKSTLLSISELINVSAEQFNRIGAFNIVLGTDTKLFVDPLLLPRSSAPEIQSGRPVLLKRFGDILKLLKLTHAKGDRTWREAERLLRFPEAKGFNLGYGGEGSHGSGMGGIIRTQILGTAFEIVSKGIEVPEIFELVGLFEEGVGADRISDMVCSVLLSNFLTYSSRIYSQAGAQNLVAWKYEEESFLLPRNPFKPEPVVLVPVDVLRELPVAYTFDDISKVCQTNEKLRSGVNDLIGKYWSDETRKMPKAEFRRLLLDNPDVLKELLAAYRRAEGSAYDIKKDPKDFQASYYAAKRAAKDYPLALHLATHAQKDVLDVVNTICNRFKENMEDRDLWRELYKDTEYENPRTEKTAQRLFYVIALEHCDANKLDLTPESNAGRGPVDFKVSHGTTKVLVEVKLAHNKDLDHAFDTQVPLYQKAERTQDSILLIVKVKEKNPKLDVLLERVARLDAEKVGRPRIVVIDGLPKNSASKA